MDQHTIAVLKRYHDADLVDACAALRADADKAEAAYNAALEACNRIDADYVSASAVVRLFMLQEARAAVETAWQRLFAAYDALNTKWEAMIASLPTVPALAEL